jgi:hypothetical protein
MSIALDNIIAIHGVPRSGTSWLGQLFNSSENVAYRFQPFFSHAFRGRVDEHTGALELQRFFADLLATNDGFVLQAENGQLSAEAPQFEKAAITRLVYKEVRFHHLLPHMLAMQTRLKAIGIVRDPRSVLSSWVRAPREFDPSWSLVGEWRHAPHKNAGLEETWFGFARWKQLTECFLGLTEQYPERFRLVRYEELIQDPESSVRALFDFCGLTFGNQTRRFVAESTSRDDGDAYGVFRRHEAPRAVGIDALICDRIAGELRGTPLFRFLAE